MEHLSRPPGHYLKIHNTGDRIIHENPQLLWYWPSERRKRNLENDLIDENIARTEADVLIVCQARALSGVKTLHLRRGRVSLIWNGRKTNKKCQNWISLVPLILIHIFRHIDSFLSTNISREKNQR